MSDFAQIVYLLVRVTPNGSRLLGTAFAVGGQGGKYLATCLHVVEGDDQNLSVVMPRDRFDGYQDTTNVEFFVQPVKMYQPDPIHDLAVLTFAEPSTSTTISYTIGGTDDIAPGSPVITLGFPHADAGRAILTRHDTTIGARILMSNKGIASKHAVLNTLLRPGQSGGPVFNPKTGRVVGVLVGSYAAGGGGLLMIQGVDPSALNQTAHAVSAEYLTGMIP